MWRWLVIWGLGRIGRIATLTEPWVLGCDRLDRPPVTHRLDGEAASTATGDRHDALSPDPNALHRDPRKGTGPRQLEVAPAVLAKLWQLKDQTSRQRLGATNRALTDPALSRRCHSTPGARRALVEVGRIATGSGPSDSSCPASRPAPAVVAGAPAAGLLLVATGRPPPPPARPPPSGSRPQRRSRSGDTTAASATPPRHSPFCCAPSVHQCNPGLPNQRRANRGTRGLPAHTAASHHLLGEAALGWDHGLAGAPKASGPEGQKSGPGRLGPHDAGSSRPPRSGRNRRTRPLAPTTSAC